MTGATAAGLIIASAADSGYFPLLQDAVASVRALNRDVAIGVLDLGLAPAERDWLQERAARVVRPDWDVDFPGRERTPETLKAQVARPFLPRHFPGHEMYFWLDADAWLQEWRIVELYCKAAGRDKLAIVPEIDRAYNAITSGRNCSAGRLRGNATARLSAGALPIASVAIRS
ncbi:MAG: hypothetical protein JO008_02665 [Alphaproteobacteria bacterium]|nr:hypothetical protein [Alphaproteobacteria bacterium]